MVHAALLLLILEAVPMDLVFTISLKRSTPNLQLTTSRRPITPSHEGRSGNVAIGTNSTLLTQLGHWPLKTFAVQKSLFAPSLVRDIVFSVAWTRPRGRVVWHSIFGGEK